jgi:hypothetical protein
MQAAVVGMVESQKFSLLLILSRWPKYSELSERRQTDQSLLLSDGRKLDQKTTYIGKQRYKAKVICYTRVIGKVIKNTALEP